MDRKDPNYIFDNPGTTKYQGDERITLLHLSQWDYGSYIKDILAENPYDVIINTLYIHDSKFSAINPLETVWTNEIFTADLMETLRRADFTGKIIHVSTDKVYGPEHSDLPLKETSVCNPKGIRGITRLNQENIVRGWGETYGMPYIIPRLGTLYGNFGPNDKALSAWCIAALNNEPLLVYGNGRTSRDWVHTFDASLAIFDLAMTDEQTVNNEIYNIGAKYKYERFLQNIAENIKSFLRPLNPNPTIRYNAPARDSAEEKGMHLWLDCTKASDKFGYETTYDFDAKKVQWNVTYWVAQSVLGWEQVRLYELQRRLGFFSEAEKQAARKESFEAVDKDNVSPEMGGSIARLETELGTSQFTLNRARKKK